MQYLDSLGTDQNRIEIVEHQADWRQAFRQESERLLSAVGNVAVKIEHIGSTAIPGLAAKPVLDMMLGFYSIEDAQRLVNLIEGLGYDYLGEFGIAGRFFFVYRSGDKSKIHLHGFILDSDDWRRHLYFRNVLRSNPELVAQYHRLKQALAKKYHSNRMAYSKGKSAFIKKIEAGR